METANGERLLILLIYLCIFTPLILKIIFDEIKKRKKWKEIEEKWKEIEELNKSVGITYDNSYTDERGYLRWKKNERLCHRDIAWESGKRGKDLFSKCEVHHIDKNKLNNIPINLEVLTKEEHDLIHHPLIQVYEENYRYYCDKKNIKIETYKAYLLVNNKWIPKSLTIIEDNKIYIVEWLYKKYNRWVYKNE